MFLEEITMDIDKTIYGGPSSINGGYWRDYFVLDVKDTLKLSSSYVSYLDQTDRGYMQSRFCYEQFTPKEYSKHDKKMYMLEKLNQYFGENLGIEGRLVERDVYCYVLKSKNNDFVNNNNGKTPLSMALMDGVFKLFSNNPEKYLSFMIDETGLKNVKDLVLPNTEGKYTFEDIILSLDKFGVIMEEKLRTIKFVEIRDRN